MGDSPESCLVRHFFQDRNVPNVYFHPNHRYTFGTLIGESITRETRTSRANALRWIIAVWILYCVVLCASFAGNFKAYLTLPVYTGKKNF